MRKAAVTVPGHSLAWVSKAIPQKILSALGLFRLYHLVQRLRGRLKAFHPSARSEYAAKLASDTAAFRPLAGASMLEIGTGWVPVVPLLLHLMGAGRILTIDLNRHLQAGLTLRAVPLLADCFEDIHRRCGADVAAMQHRLQRLLAAKTVDELFALANIEYRAPGNAAETDLPAGSIDIVYSNLVLEHVTPSALAAITAEARRILAPGGVCWHNVDHGDHYAATRPGMSIINFLTYSQRTWDWLGQNDILWQNRWRSIEYRHLFERHGFEVAHQVKHEDPSVREDLAGGLPLHRDWLHFGAAELAVVSTRFVLRALPDSD